MVNPICGITAPAQARQETEAPLRVYLECSACDFDFVRTEVAYVDWMRDRADADLHVLARNQNTGLMYKSGVTQVEVWTYDRGSTAPPMIVTIVDGRIKSIERSQ